MWTFWEKQPKQYRHILKYIHSAVFAVIGTPGAYKIIQTDKMQIPHNQLSLPVFKSSFYHFPLRRYACLKF